MLGFQRLVVPPLRELQRHQEVEIHRVMWGGNRGKAFFSSYESMRKHYFILNLFTEQFLAPVITQDDHPCPKPQRLQRTHNADYVLLANHLLCLTQ